MDSFIIDVLFNKMVWRDSQPRTTFRSSLVKCKGMKAFTVPTPWTSNPLRTSDYLPLPTSQHLPMVTSITHFITIVTNVDSAPEKILQKDSLSFNFFCFFLSTKQHKCTSYFLHSFNFFFYALNWTTYQHKLLFSQYSLLLFWKFILF